MKEKLFKAKFLSLSHVESLMIKCKTHQTYSAQYIKSGPPLEAREPGQARLGPWLDFEKYEMAAAGHR